MKSTSLLALPCLLLSLSAFAAGNHVGGHDGEAIGQPGVASNVTRTVKIDMTDAMRFKASKISVKQGETVRFVVSNSGKLKHEMVLGTKKILITRLPSSRMRSAPSFRKSSPVKL